MLETLPELTNVVLDSHSAIPPQAGGAIGVGLAAIGTGYAQRGIGAAAVGAVAEDSDNFVSGLIFTAIPETLIIIAFVSLFLVL
jgi:V/A-type H+-transporting ATPase subunit K